MPSLHVDASPSPTGVVALLRTDDGVLDATVRVDSPTTPLVSEPDVFLAPGVLLSMAIGHDLEMATADPVALAGARGAGDLLHSWFPSHLAPTRVRAEPVAPRPVERATTRSRT